MRTEVWRHRIGRAFRTPTLGIPGINVERFCDLARCLRDPRPDPVLAKPGRLLDTGVEAQVHGPIELSRDVERLVADPAFATTPTGQALEALAGKYKLRPELALWLRTSGQRSAG
ncbi:MAG: DUF3626 domain-containing protein [Paludibaculum sp.]